MKLKTNCSICAFDVETTGTKPETDKIVSLSVVKYCPDIDQPKVFNWLINPGIDIPIEASAIHGITNEMVTDKPKFLEIAEELYNVFNGCDLLVYNKSFDPVIIAEEFARAGYEYPTQETRIVDVMKIYHKKEQRSLYAAYKFYCDKDLEGAHNSETDILATIEILNAQLDRYSDLSPEIDFITDYCESKGRIDAAGRFAYNPEGDEIFTFGSNKGKKVKDNLGMLNWMLKAEFSENSKMWCRRLLKKYSTI